ncbi:MULTISPECIES: diguanylate cyclase domain-containing protein [Erwinia]|uniref:Diguanylate cyclase n=1 Tax=Erwinia rhapontici TaxID=55212 RepID=A0ABM7N5X4_ERWRD|nr:diguanylate cyclase [Erwinia rhapontici]MBP2153000.1 diguanylate cyclase (GGDEF)-like protein [Erwinia rhapontici]MCS3608339.1 diguanylate cyclase (GGDEF)-like protein [Erwinia rhapontici]NKG31538.1 diguanylate cyclase [Erwinia rhapontici]BCQ36885.1 diguanylate cyclase [Erwinia rhapontici]BCQ41892.1 diguanylate cyclase [Erwinia rhapontici]
MKIRQNEAVTVARELPTMRQSFQRIHLVIIVVSLLFSGLSLSALSMYVLRSYAENNIQLVAASVSYSARTAVLQNDSATAESILRDMGTRTEFAVGRVYRADQQLLAQWQAPGGEDPRGAGAVVARWLFPQPVSAPVMHNNQEVGRVWISGDASRVLHYLGQALLWLGGSLLITAMLAIYLARRMHAGILQGLQNIASVAHDVRKRRAFSLRVPSSSIAELDKLSGDFNSLLDELDQWQRHLTSENDSLTHQTLHDTLTGLPNRKAFEQHLQALMDDPETRQQASVLFIDGDRFKQVNDCYGHAAGDHVLMVTAQRLRERLRKGDLVARLGGDEFAVVLSTVEREEQVAQVARDIIEAMQPPIVLPEGARVVQSLSVGVALAKNHSSPEALIAQADAAMYHIKELGGGWYLSPSYWGQEIPGLPPQVAVATGRH